MAERLHIITPVSRPHLLPQLAEGVQALREVAEVIWWLVFDGTTIQDVPQVEGITVVALAHPAPADPRAGGHLQRSKALDVIEGGWVWVLDDDNLVHPAFGPRLAALWAAYPHAGAFVVSQQRADGRVLRASLDALRPEAVDTAQYVVRREVIGDERVQPIPGDDGGFIQRIAARHPEAVVCVDEVLCYHNWASQ